MYISKLIYSIMFTWMGQYSYEDAYTVKKVSDHLAIETSGRYTYCAHCGNGGVFVEGFVA